MTPPRHPPPPAWAVLADELHRRSLRGIKRLVRPWWLRRLGERNRQAREPLLSGDGPVVSLTTYEPRWPRVHYTIESIGAGRLRPSRILLWVSPPVLALGLPDALKRQADRGLEIRTCEDHGPHKKYYPFVAEGRAERGLVTADDDVLYPADWLSSLTQAAARRPAHVHAHRARVMSFAADGSFQPYASWPACRSTQPSALHFSTGVGGVWYPPAMQQALREAGAGFLAVCPRADDIWLNAVAWRTGVEVCQVGRFHPLLFEVPGTRDHGLARFNVDGGGNDRQLAATFTEPERRGLRALSQQEYGEAVA